MNQYKQKTPFATAMDRLLLRLAVVGLGVLWFVFLWGLTLPALAAGFALGCLLWLSLRRFEALSIQRKAEKLRQKIGGEIAVDKLLLLPARHGAFQAATWLSSSLPIELTRTTDSGVLCRYLEETALVQLIAQHESLPVTVQQVIDAHKEANRKGATRLAVCLTAPVSREGKAYAQSAAPPIKLVSREELIRLAGKASPATDDQLRGMAHKGPHTAGWARWLEVVLAPARARGYFLYGLGLTLMGLITGFPYYPIPAVICLGLCVLCRWYKPRHREEAWQ